MEDEIVNSLMLGAVTAVARQPSGRRRHRPLFALVEESGEPVLAMAWTLPHKLLLSTHTPVGSQAVMQLIGQLGPERGRPGVVFGPAELARRFAHAWVDERGGSVRTGLRQRLMALRQVVLPQSMAEGSLHVGVMWNRDLLGGWIAAFQAEAVPAEATDLETAMIITERLLMDENLFIWLASADGDGPQPVSMAAKARPTETGVAINLVYTPPAYRRRGYASACVASLSQQLLEDGWQFCTLFTDLTNPTSNHIYQTIGYQPIADFTQYHLIAGE